MESVIQSSYLGFFLRHRDKKKVIQEICRHITNRQLDFDTIAFRGVSGGLVAPAVAYELGKEVLIVRKETTHHSSFMVEGNMTARKIFIIDDFLCSGKTALSIIDNIVTAMRHFSRNLYDGDYTNDKDAPNIVLERHAWTQQLEFKVTFIGIGCYAYEPKELETRSFLVKVDYIYPDISTTWNIPVFGINPLASVGS